MSGAEPDLTWFRKRSQVNWLVWSIEKSRRRRHSEDELLNALRQGLSKSQRENVLREIGDRLEADDSGAFAAQVLDALKHLAIHNTRPGPVAQETDRLLRRLLWRLPGEAKARALALSCAESRRLQRQVAAWRFYSTHGLDADALPVVAGHAKTNLNDLLAKLVIHDAELLEQVGLEEMLVRTADPYWRGRILQTWLEAKKPLGNLIDSHPSETMFAIRRAERRDLLGLGHRLFEENRSDPGVLAAAVQLFGDLGSSAEQADAIAAGLELLDGIPEPEKDWMGLNQVLDRLRSDPLTASDNDSLSERTVEHPHSQSTLW